METVKKTHLKKSTRALLICFALLICVSVLNWAIVSNGGDVKITRITLIGDNGLHHSALLYVPANATDETPAPAIMMYHGLSGSARNHESWAIEFTRRGFVCLAPDNMGAGNSEFAENGNEFNSSIIGQFTDYLLSLPFVDTTRWAVSGHSLGADSSLAMALKYQPPVALFSDGGGKTYKEIVSADNYLHGNFMWLLGMADKSVNLDASLDMVKTMLDYKGIKVEGDVVPSELYGSFEDRTAGKLVLIPTQVHEGAFTTPKHIEEMLNFVQSSFEVPNPLEGINQIWMAKDVCGMVGMILFVCFLISFVLYIIQNVPAFSMIQQPLPRNIGMRGVPLIISIVAAVLFPVLTLYTGSFGLLNLLAGKGGKGANLPLFSVRFTNIAFSVIIALNVFGALMFVLFHKTWGKKNIQATLRDYGLTVEGNNKISIKLIGKSLLLAAMAITVGWTYLQIQQSVFGTDFYCLFWGYKPIAAYKLLYYIPYMVIWAICFVVAALGMCVERRLPTTGVEWKDNAIAVSVNIVLAILGIAVILVLEDILQIKAGWGKHALSDWGIPLTRIWGMPIGMILGAGGNTYLYRKTGNVWLGAIMMGFIAALGACLYGQIRF